MQRELGRHDGAAVALLAHGLVDHGHHLVHADAGAGDIVTAQVQDGIRVHRAAWRRSGVAVQYRLMPAIAFLKAALAASLYVEKTMRLSPVLGWSLR